MNYTSTFKLKLDNVNDVHTLLLDEDFDFKNKDIVVDILKEKDCLNISVSCNSLIELKIANSAIIKSLEIIQKTWEI